MNGSVGFLVGAGWGVVYRRFLLFLRAFIIEIDGGLFLARLFLAWLFLARLFFWHHFLLLLYFDFNLVLPIFLSFCLLSLLLFLGFVDVRGLVNKFDLVHGGVEWVQTGSYLIDLLLIVLLVDLLLDTIDRKDIWV